MNIKELRKTTKIASKIKKKKDKIFWAKQKKERIEAQARRLQLGREEAHRYFNENHDKLTRDVLKTANSGSYEIRIRHIRSKSNKLSHRDIGWIQIATEWAKMNGLSVRVKKTFYDHLISISIYKLEAEVYLSWKKPFWKFW